MTAAAAAAAGAPTGEQGGGGRGRLLLGAEVLINIVIPHFLSHSIFGHLYNLVSSLILDP